MATLPSHLLTVAQTAGYDSDYCNKTITLGVTKPPIVRRSPSGNSVFPGVKLPFDTPSAPLTIQEAHPVTVTSQLVLTITACALAVIYLRPRMQAFQPTLSMARSTPKRTVIPTMNAVRFADDEIQSQHPQKTASLGADADALICHTDSLRAHAFYRYCPGCECRYQAVEDEIGIRSCDACFTSIFQSDRSNVRKRTSRRKRKALRKAIEGEPLPKVRSMMSLERDTAQTGSQLEAPLAYTPSILQLRDDPKAYICYECPGLQGFATSAQLRRHRRSHWRPELHLQPPGGNTSLVGLDHVEGISSTSCRNSAPSEMCSTMSNERLELDRPDAEQMDGVELRPYLQLQIQQPFSRLPNSSVDSLSPCTEVEEAGVWATISDLRLATARQEAVRMQARSADSVNACCAEMQMAYIPGSEIIPTHTKHTGNSWYPVPCL